MSLEHQQHVENNFLWDPELDSRLASIAEAAARGKNMLDGNHQLPTNDDTSIWQTPSQAPSYGQVSETPYSAAASTPLGGGAIYPITPTRPPSLFHHPPSFYTPPQVTAQTLQAHTPFHRQFTFPTNATPPAAVSSLSKRVIDIKSTEDEPLAPPSKRSRQIDSSEKENKPEKANEVEGSHWQEKVVEVELVSAPNTNSGSVDLAAAKGGGKKLTKKEKTKLKAEEEVVNSMRSYWADSEKTTLFEWLLGPDSDKLADKLKVNPGRVFKKAVDSVFNGKYNAASIKGQYERSLKTFGFILQLESFTGGGGDADENGYGYWIDAARRGGAHVGSLTAKTLEKWFELGWYDLFKSRCVGISDHQCVSSFIIYNCVPQTQIYSHGKSPKVTRPVVYSSSQPLSDIDSDLAGGDTSSNSDDFDASPVKPALSSKRKPSREASKVSEPKYKPPSTKARQQNLASASSGLTEYLKSKAELDKARSNGLKLRQQVELAKEMLADTTTSLELRAAAEAILLKALQD
ncbi:hypothetical protein JOM56_013212 [Amanita muscaria]